MLESVLLLSPNLLIAVWSFFFLFSAHKHFIPSAKSTLFCLRRKEKKNMLTRPLANSCNLYNVIDAVFVLIFHISGHNSVTSTTKKKRCDTHATIINSTCSVLVIMSSCRKKHICFEILYKRQLLAADANAKHDFSWSKENHSYKTKYRLIQKNSIPAITVCGSAAV